MHWYYRLDRANNRHCWYLQAAGMQVRSHEIVPLLTPRPQIVADQSLAPLQKEDPQTSLSQPATAADVFIESGVPTIDSPSAANFSGRWPNISASVDSGGSGFAQLPHDSAGEDASARSEELALSTQLAPAETISRFPHKATAAKFWIVFIGGAISVILFGELLKLIHVLSRSLGWCRLKTELDDGPKMSLGELMQALRRVDEIFEAQSGIHRASGATVRSLVCAIAHDEEYHKTPASSVACHGAALRLRS
jgi:hypothetical protein